VLPNTLKGGRGAFHSAQLLQMVGGSGRSTADEPGGAAGAAGAAGCCGCGGACPAGSVAESQAAIVGGCSERQQRDSQLREHCPIVPDRGRLFEAQAFAAQRPEERLASDARRGTGTLAH
jgi:hypothetical protein